MTRILSLAADAGWIDRKPKLQIAREATVRVHWLTQAKADQFLNAIRLNWVRDSCEFALATDCRAAEIFSLTWDKVDLGRSLAWVTNDLARSGRARAVPLNEHAVEAVKRRIGTHASLVFSRIWAGSQIEQIDRRAFTAAMKEVGLRDFRFHDLRHTWASWHVQNGTPLFVLKELGGWETLDMVKKYAHLDAGHLAQYANHVTFRSQQTAGKKKAA
ncbi:site-specific integrase [Alcaligenes sp. RM2]|nr:MULTISPECIES: site-specific integrase [Alcaligenes]URW84100.1 site-specific integrase [Alcaligenes sp. DN25]UTM01982.1 site-specific integrase [Alcaligenes sp. NLF5-7]WEA68939.1 site-specific integrase [Alcaligenes faecalis]